jgi:hypothetical protein
MGALGDLGGGVGLWDLTLVGDFGGCIEDARLLTSIAARTSGELVRAGWGVGGSRGDIDRVVQSSAYRQVLSLSSIKGGAERHR